MNYVKQDHSSGFLIYYLCNLPYFRITLIFGAIKHKRSNYRVKKFWLSWDSGTCMFNVDVLLTAALLAELVVRALGFFYRQKESDRAEFKVKPCMLLAPERRWRSCSCVDIDWCFGLSFEATLIDLTSEEVKCIFCMKPDTKSAPFFLPRFVAAAAST